MELRELRIILDLEKLENHVYKVFDPEQEGFIDFRRFMLVIIALSGGDPEENLEKIFFMVDINNDGFITAEVTKFYIIKETISF